MVRLTSGSGGGGVKKSIASRIIRETISKGGKIDENTFKKIMKAKLAEAAANSGNASSSFGMGQNRQRSKSAQKAVDMMKEMQNEKKARQARKEVVIVPTRLINGKIDDKGRVMDAAGNMIAKIRIKDGTITAVDGQYLGVYKPKSMSVNNALQDAINKKSPYLLNQRKAIEMQKLRDQEYAQSMEQEHGNSFGLDDKHTNRDAGTIWRGYEVDLWGNRKESRTDFWGNVKKDFWGNPIY